MTTGSTAADDERDDGIGRLNALTDGVVAIAITLLALDLKPDLSGGASSRQLAHYLYLHAADYVAFVIAFFIIAQYWVLHRQRMRRVVRSSGALVRVTLLFLFAITIAPLTSSINGSENSSLAITLFAANIALMGASVGALDEVIKRQHLDDVEEDRRQRVLRVSRSITSVAIAGLVAGMAWVLERDATYFFFLYLIADRPGQLAWHIVGGRAGARPTVGT